MRDNTYIMTFLIATCCMLLVGLSVTGIELYQYSSGGTAEATASAPAEEATASEAESETPETTSSDTEAVKEDGS